MDGSKRGALPILNGEIGKIKQNLKSQKLKTQIKNKRVICLPSLRASQTPEAI
jgi:hypothetical protein